MNLVKLQRKIQKRLKGCITVDVEHSSACRVVFYRGGLRNVQGFITHA